MQIIRDEKKISLPSETELGWQAPHPQTVSKAVWYTRNYTQRFNLSGKSIAVVLPV